MDSVWSKIEHHTYLSILVENVKKGVPMNRNDVDLLYLLSKKLQTDSITDDTTQWFLKVVNEVILTYFWDNNADSSHDDHSKTLLDIFKITCSVQIICEQILTNLCEKLQKCLHNVDNDINNGCDSSLDTAMLMVQMAFDCVKRNKFSLDNFPIKEKFVQQSAELIQLECISDRNFLIATHILGVVLDVENPSHQNVRCIISFAKLCVVVC